MLARYSCNFTIELDVICDGQLTVWNELEGEEEVLLECTLLDTTDDEVGVSQAFIPMADFCRMFEMNSSLWLDEVGTYKSGLILNVDRIPAPVAVPVIEASVPF